ncbi:hypothetical protein [Streptomyces sp. DH12]|uniref:hypothetical protein n=1 Tax=Streptomyces sp. DH12 TaxID=2857010 RepID=UPI001E64ACAE|nr:hypothetical protein [Streptomyces sp. DH12]
MRPKVYRAAALAALLAWSSVACTAGGDTASIDQATLAGPWTNEAGARLVFEADRRATGTDLGSALPGTLSCPDSLSGTWSFFSAPTDTGFSAADASLTSGDTIGISITSVEDHCSLSAVVRRDAHGYNLCLVADPDSDCSTNKELLRPAPPGPEQSQ